MTTAILDTNIVVQSVISSPPSAAARVLDAYYDGRFRFVYSPATLDELTNILAVQHIRDRHGMSDEEILELVASLLTYEDCHEVEHYVSPAITRDVTDTKFLALAEQSGADYLVTNDRRHLLPLKQYGQTRILSPAQFLRQIR